MVEINFKICIRLQITCKSYSWILVLVVSDTQDTWNGTQMPCTAGPTNLFMGCHHKVNTKRQR